MNIRKNAEQGEAFLQAGSTRLFPLEKVESKLWLWYIRI